MGVKDRGEARSLKDANWTMEELNATVGAVVDAGTFIGLTDAPSDYTGAGEYIVRVKATEDGVEFAELTTTLIGLGNVPNTDCTNASNISTGTLDVARLPVSDVTAGSYTTADITVDAYGRITAASNGDAGSATDEKVKCSSNDTTADYLEDKLVAGTNVTITTNNDGGEETITISSSGAGAGSFIDLNDTDPANYTGQGGYFVVVNSTPDGLEFISPGDAKTSLSLAKADVGLGNVANVDTTDASNIDSGTLPDARLSEAGDAGSYTNASITVDAYGRVTSASNGSGVYTDQLAKVSSNDTTAGYLNGKLVAGTGITLTEGDNGGDETLTVACTVTDTDTDSFIDLTDVGEADYTGHAGDVVRVNSTPNGLEFHTLAKTDVGLGNVPNTDCTNASNISSGTLANARLSANVVLNNAAINLGDQTVEGASAKLVELSGTTLTLDDDDNGCVIYTTSASATTITVPSGLATGFNVTVVQMGAGQVTFSGSGTTIRNAHSETKTYGQYAVVGVIIQGTNAILYGDTGT